MARISTRNLIDGGERVTPTAPVETPAATPTSQATATNRYYNYYTGTYVSDPSLIVPPGMAPKSTIPAISTETSQEVPTEEPPKEEPPSKEPPPKEEPPSKEPPGRGGKTVVSTYTDPETGDVIAVYSDGTTAVLSKGTKAADAAKAAAAAKLKEEQDAARIAEEKRRQGQSAYTLLFSEFDRYGLGALVAPLQNLIEQGLSRDEFTLKLRETDAYKKRFAANQQRIAKGLRAISEAEYVNLEDQYQDVMRRYGLPASYYARGDMGRQEGFERFIGGDVSAPELEDRIQTAQRRVINAAPQIKDALTQFYGNEISNGDILAYVLDPEKAIEGIKRKVTAAEIGGAATMAGLGTGVSRAEELARFGVTGETARQGFQTIAGGLERGRQLASIYQQPAYTQGVAEAEVFQLPSAEEARRQRTRLGKLEQAEFGGTTGMTGGALARERAGQY